jgi:hypothetical protein
MCSMLSFEIFGSKGMEITNLQLISVCEHVLGGEISSHRPYDVQEVHFGTA